MLWGEGLGRLHSISAPLLPPPSSPQDLSEGKLTVYFGFSGKLAAAHGEEWDTMFAMINSLGK